MTSTEQKSWISAMTSLWLSILISSKQNYSTAIGKTQLKAHNPLMIVATLIFSLSRYSMAITSAKSTKTASGSGLNINSTNMIGEQSNKRLILP